MASLAVSAPDAKPPYHWTPQLQRAFLEALAETGSIGQAVAAVRMSRRAAYNLRYRGEGAAFRIGWDAALLIARATLADTLMERAISGQDDMVEREGNIITRHRCDNRLGMSLLSRLDRMADTDLNAGSDGALARRVSQDFEAFLDLVEGGGTADAVALFVANGQCELVAAAPPDDPAARAARMKVWRSKFSGQWRTSFPPPPGFRGYQSCVFGARDYQRALTRQEREAAAIITEAELAPLFEAGDAARDAWFGFAPSEITGDDDENEEEDDYEDGDEGEGEDREGDGDDYEDQYDEAGEGELEKGEEGALTRNSDLPRTGSGAVEAPSFLLAGEQDKESPSISSRKPDPEPAPAPAPALDSTLRPVPAPPRPVPYAGGRPPEWLEAANRRHW